ncbi:hypothetical protein LX83_000890 [Goodfellowiella coeruleoviolacea]|uniref:Uncharacterized protein n=1 Tax=Goodfellowiella coeruleoviolacea TaxID=334858 RepID=A0AAE3G9J6_9PSEU|nr:hypothetical protein [Goodfellowiella coeruleoviolacea]
MLLPFPDTTPAPQPRRTRVVHRPRGYPQARPPLYRSAPPADRLERGSPPVVGGGLTTGGSSTSRPDRPGRHLTGQSDAAPAVRNSPSARTQRVHQHRYLLLPAIDPQVTLIRRNTVPSITSPADHRGARENHAPQELLELFGKPSHFAATGSSTSTCTRGTPATFSTQRRPRPGIAAQSNSRKPVRKIKAAHPTAPRNASRKRDRVKPQPIERSPHHQTESRAGATQTTNHYSVERRAEFGGDGMSVATACLRRTVRPRAEPSSAGSGRQPPRSPAGSSVHLGQPKQAPAQWPVHRSAGVVDTSPATQQAAPPLARAHPCCCFALHLIGMTHITRDHQQDQRPGEHESTEDQEGGGRPDRRRDATTERTDR